MRRSLIGLVVLALVTACSDSSPTSTAPALKNRPSSVTVTGTLDDNIQSLISLWPQGLSTASGTRWQNIKDSYNAGQISVAKSKLTELTKFIIAKTPNMTAPPGGESRQSAASRLVLYMAMYIYGGPNTTPPPYFPGADDAVGLLTPNTSLTLVTPSGDAGAQFPLGSTDVDRIIVITQNPTPYGNPCDGPLTTARCQYPLFYDITSFPDTKLLMMGKAAICHPPEDSDRGPTAANHPYLRLAHKKPANPSDYTPGSTVPTEEGEDIEILPLISQTFVVCTDVAYTLPPGDFYDFHTVGALQSLRKFAVNVGRFFLPKSAYAIDQGGGGGFELMSPFNNVDTRYPVEIIN